jgi:RNA polymerase sigma-70 factor (ECF subfamily)
MHDHHLAHDITQETFLKAFKKLDKLRDESKLDSWLAAIASRTAIDFLRKSKKWNEFTVEDGYIELELSRQQQVAASVEEVFESKQAFNLISELNPESKQVIILKYEFDMKDDDIAK